MISFFSIPKPFHEHFARIQMNAFQSWRKVTPDGEIMLFGDAGGIEPPAASVKARHYPAVATNAHGTPLLSDVFHAAQSRALFDILCFINSDIVLMQDFLAAVESVASDFDQYLLIGQRIDVAVESPIDFAGDWEADLRRLAATAGRLDPPTAIDYFVFSRGLFDDVPAFAVGRPPYDHWLVADALQRGIPVIDATAAVTAIHQKHDYSHVKGGKSGAYHGEEARRNQALAGDYSRHRDIGFSTHMFDSDGGIRPARGTKYRDARRRLWRRRLITWSRPLRHRLGIRTRKGPKPSGCA